MKYLDLKNQFDDLASLGALISDAPICVIKIKDVNGQSLEFENERLSQNYLSRLYEIVLQSSGSEIGTLSVFAEEMRNLTKNEVQSLTVLARIVTFQVVQHQHITHSIKLALLGEMAGGIAHELNNPLAIIQSNAALIRRYAAEGVLDLKLYCALSEKIVKIIDRISKIIKGLKGYTQNQEQEPFEVVDISLMVSDALSFCLGRFIARGVNVRIFKNDEPQLVLGNPVQLSQVLLNLLNNSFDSISESVGSWIEIEVAEKISTIDISVTDSGNGIVEAHQEKIFEQFFTTKTKNRGTGLGLSISRQLVIAHGGILYYDTLSKNTRFTVQLPKWLENK